VAEARIEAFQPRDRRFEVAFHPFRGLAAAGARETNGHIIRKLIKFVSGGPAGEQNGLHAMGGKGLHQALGYRMPVAPA
jgi:hypothetical protein